MIDSAAPRTHEEAREPKLPLTVDDPIWYAELLIDHVELRKFYKARKIRCFGCAVGEVESFKEGCEVHGSGPFGGFDAAKLVAELNELGRKHPFSEKTAVELGLVRRLIEWAFPDKT